uniref:Putative secreted protein n=1 Tax=Anopheles darlingi TaxID=43151 RepID=A0A2M4DMS9_ANODA
MMMARNTVLVPTVVGLRWFISCFAANHGYSTHRTILLSLRWVLGGFRHSRWWLEIGTGALAHQQPAAQHRRASKNMDAIERKSNGKHRLSPNTTLCHPSPRCCVVPRARSSLSLWCPR